MAIEHALNILSWFENLSKDERPPEYLWDDTEGLNEWWERVEAKRNDGTPTSRGHQDHDPTDAGGQEMVENDQARYLKAAYK